MSAVHPRFTVTECSERLQAALAAAREIKDEKKEIEAISNAYAHYTQCIKTASPELEAPSGALLRDLSTLESRIAAIRNGVSPRPQSSNTVRYTDPEGRVAYSQYNDGPVYSNGEALPNVPADRVTLKTTAVTRTMISDWTNPPWAGWEMEDSSTFGD